MKKATVVLVSLIMAMVMTVSLIPGCSSNNSQPTQAPATTTAAVAAVKSSPAPSATTRSVTDLMGKTVTIPSPANLHNVAVLTSPQIIDMYIVGQQAKLCAVTNAVKQWNFLAQIDPRIKTLPAVRAQVAQINIESLLQTNPDICIGSDTDMQVIDKNTSIPTLRVDTSVQSSFLAGQEKEVRFFGDIFGNPDAANKYVSYLENNRSNINSALSGVAANQKLKVYMGYNADHLTTYGGDTFMNEWIQAGGCVNAAQTVTAVGGNEGGLSTVSMEQILNWNPDIIVIDTGKPQDLYADPVWSKLSAVQNKKVYVLPVGMFIWNRASSEAAAMVPMWLGLTAYPDKFPNDSAVKELKKFYSDIINYTLTDNDAKAILNQ